MLALSDRFLVLHDERPNIDTGKPADDAKVGDILDEQGRLLDALQTSGANRLIAILALDHLHFRKPKPHPRLVLG